MSATKNYTMEQVITLWKKEGKKGTPYFTGLTSDRKEVRGFYNNSKKNLKEPDLRIYALDSQGNVEKEETASLWVNSSKDGKKKYLSGKTAWGARVVGFINEKADHINKLPYVRIYLADEKKSTDSEVVQDMKAERMEEAEQATMVTPF